MEILLPIVALFLIGSILLFYIVPKLDTTIKSLKKSLEVGDQQHSTFADNIASSMPNDDDKGFIESEKTLINLIERKSDQSTTYHINSNHGIGFYWFIKTGEYIRKDQPILAIFSYYDFNEGTIPTNSLFKNSFGMYPEKSKIIRSSSEGFIKVLYNDVLSYKPRHGNQDFFSIYANDIDRQRDSYPIGYNLTKDRFTNEEKYLWDTVALGHGLSFRPENIDGKDFLCFEYDYTIHRLSSADRINFLFENEEVLKFQLSGVNYKVRESLKGFRLPLFREEIEILSTFSIVEIRIEISSENQKIDIQLKDDGNGSGRDKQYIIKATFQSYQEVVSKLDKYSPIERGEGDIAFSKSENECTVYLMVDIINNYHKIGISSSPLYREKTLQSEKPTIELIAYKKFVNRRIASTIEKALHETYADKRIRGEWFQLNSLEIEEIKTTLTN